MRPRVALEKLNALLERPLFTSKEAKEVGVSTSTLDYYVRSGALRRINRGIYQKTGYKDRKTFKWGDLIEAYYSVRNGVICLISALAVYDLTEEIPRQHWLAISHRTSVQSNRNLKIVRFRNMHLGRVELDLEGVKISIFDRERTVVDAFRLLSRETAIKALKMALAKGGKNRVDLIKLQAYAKQLQVNITPYLMSITA